MNLRNVLLITATLAASVALPAARATSSPEAAFTTCSLNSPHFSACLSRSAEATVRRDPSQPEASSVHTIAVRDPTTGAYESTVALLSTSTPLSLTLAGQSLTVTRHARPDGTTEVVVEPMALDGALATYLDGVERIHQAP